MGLWTDTPGVSVHASMIVWSRGRPEPGGLERGVVFDRLHHVQLALPRDGEPAARAFYGDVLGMTEVAKPSGLAGRGGVWFRAGAAELHLGVEEGFRPARKAHPGFLVDDLDDVVERLRRVGQDVTWDGDFPGYRRLYAHDPFGNRLEFLESG